MSSKKVTIELTDENVIMYFEHAFSNTDVMKIIEVLAHQYIVRNGQPFPEFDHELHKPDEDKE